MDATELAIHLSRFSQSIAKARDGDDEIAALILFFCYTDALGSLLRPKDATKTTSVYFKRYVTEFLLPGSGLPVTENDLWGARCGMLHTFSPYSDLVVGPAPQARKIVYVKSTRQAQVAAKATEAGGLTGLVFVDPYDLYNSFIDGAVFFGKKVSQDSALADGVFFHADKFFQSYSFKYA